jgi:type II secretory pathway component GspD/PulD (secretin)
MPLYTRVFKVDPNSLIDGINSVLGLSASSNRLEALAHLREFLLSSGVDLHPPKSWYFKDRDGRLLVRATRADLDRIETAISALGATPPQLVIKAQFLELSDAEETAFWIRQGGGKRGFGSVRFAEIASDELQREIEAWKSSDSAQILAESMITTLSGRQAQIQVTEMKTIVVATNSTPGSFTTQDIPLGPILDVLPTVSADTFRINLIVTASMKEFLGYDDPGASADGQGRTLMPQPHFRSRKLPVTADLWDGHALVLGGALDEQGKPADKPGDNNMRLLVVLTPTVIDPVGNRVHTDEAVKNAQNKSGSH